MANIRLPIFVKSHQDLMLMYTLRYINMVVSVHYKYAMLVRNVLVWGQGTHSAQCCSAHKSTLEDKFII